MNLCVTFNIKFSMKFKIHSSIMDRCVTTRFYKTIRLYADALGKADKKLKMVQCYSDFFLKDGTYPFMDDELIYYPLTLIYKNNEWRLHWVCWKNMTVPQPYRLGHPFCIPNDWEDFQILSCPSVPDRFKEMVANKPLIFLQKPNHASWNLCIHQIDRMRGRFHSSFVDELVRQISEELIKLAKCELDPRWSINILDYADTVKIGETRYRRLELQSRHAEARDFSVCWQEPYDICDDIFGKKVTFSLTEYPFDGKVRPLAKIAAFIQNGGDFFRDPPRSERLLMPSTYPDVTLRFALKKRADPEAVSKEVVDRIDHYVENWNNNPENEKPIHTFFPVESEEDDEFWVFVDFGSADPMALLGLLQNLRQQLPKGVKSVILL